MEKCGKFLFVHICKMSTFRYKCSLDELMCRLFCLKLLLKIVRLSDEDEVYNLGGRWLRYSWRIQKEPHRGWMKQYQQKENIIQIVPNRNVCVCLRWSVSSVIQYWSHCLRRLSDGRSICVISRWTGLLSPGTDRSELDAEMTPTPVKDVSVCVSV